MPLVRIDLAAGKPASYRAAISAGVHDAMVRTFNVPDDHRFQVIGERGPGTAIAHPPSHLGIEDSGDVVMLFAAIADNLASNPGLRREDVVINLVQVRTENWSFGNGIAQYAT